MNTPIYLDYQATTPVKPEVITKMTEVATIVGNPNSPHTFGRKVAGLALEAKDTLASFLSVDAKDIAFTSGATESIELGITGVVRNACDTYPEKKWNIITTPIEHSAVLDTCKWLENEYENISVTYLSVDSEGKISPEELKDMLSEETLLVSIMYANNEIGTVNPLRKVGKIIQSYKKDHASVYPILHSDATQAPLYLDCDISYLGVDMMTLSAHKIGGPIGIGALYARSGTPISSPRPGKAEESGLKSGTISPMLTQGFAEAIKHINPEDTQRILELQKYLFSKLKEISNVTINGPELGEGRLPCNIHISTSIPSEESLMRLDMMGISVSAGSACHSRAIEPSHVLQAITDDIDRISSALRISIGYNTTREELDFLLKILSNMNT